LAEPVGFAQRSGIDFFQGAILACDSRDVRYRTRRVSQLALLRQLHQIFVVIKARLTELRIEHIVKRRRRHPGEIAVPSVELGLHDHECKLLALDGQPTDGNGHVAGGLGAELKGTELALDSLSVEARSHEVKFT
jgi:hypothetical protein